MNRVGIKFLFQTAELVKITKCSQSLTIMRRQSLVNLKQDIVMSISAFERILLQDSLLQKLIISETGLPGTSCRTDRNKYSPASANIANDQKGCHLSLAQPWRWRGPAHRKDCDPAGHTSGNTRMHPGLYSYSLPASSKDPQVHLKQFPLGRVEHSPHKKPRLHSMVILEKRQCPQSLVYKGLSQMGSNLLETEYLQQTDAIFTNYQINYSLAVNIQKLILVPRHLNWRE